MMKRYTPQLFCAIKSVQNKLLRVKKTCCKIGRIGPKISNFGVQVLKEKRYVLSLFYFLIFFRGKKHRSLDMNYSQLSDVLY